MLFIGKGRNKKFAPITSLPPDEKSLEMKIMRAHFVSHGWINCLNPQYETLDPCEYGWKFEDEVLVPLWFHGDPLSSEEEIEYNVEIERMELDESSDNDSDFSDSDDSDVGVISAYSDCSDSDDENY